LADLPFCTFDMNESGASLTWRHFHGAPLTGADMNPLVRYVKDRDLWRWELPYSREVNAWLRSFEFDLGTWDELVFMLETGMASVIGAGAAIRRCEEQTIKRQSRHFRLVRFGDLLVRATNATEQLSDTAGELAKETGAGAVWFARTDGRIQWSIRSDGRVDVSAVAKSYGGGGHKAAAGFDVSWEEHGRLWNG
jgi:oligoribonuclease NrnB/cAMP/cGMP phosphodiesterase (DHH superfamily)